MSRRRVLFVCIGNSCRSQMAEAFARRYGSDVIEPESAGLAPCEMVAPVTKELMLEKNIDLDGFLPKGLAQTGGKFDLIVNMSGRQLPRTRAPVREWKIEDPIWVSRERHCEIRDEIEMRVQKLILELRREAGSEGL
jgi:arsenate reductase